MHYVFEFLMKNNLFFLLEIASLIDQELRYQVNAMVMICWGGTDQSRK